MRFGEDGMKTGLAEAADIISYHGYKSVPERHSAQEIAGFLARWGWSCRLG